MRLGTTSLAAAALAILAALPGLAQEGHPLKGSWIGVLEGNQTHDEFVVLVLDWDGRKISGVINPGTDEIEITDAVLDPEDWSVRFTAATEDSAGRSVNYRIEGVIEALETANRYIKGSWRNGDESGDFEIRRQ